MEVKSQVVEDPIEDFYDIGDKLGSGHFAVVKVAHHKATKKDFAVKIIDKRKLVGNQKSSVMQEVAILEQLDHPNIIKLKEIFETPRRLNLVMELVTGGELFDRIVEKGSYSEKDAALLVRDIASACMYLHSKKIVHRDLKPENLLYESKAPDAKIKLADFGLSTLVAEEDMLKTACGTPGYVAPEVLSNKGYGAAVDIWSVGVILYILLCGFPPFYEENTAKLFDQIMNARYDFPSPYWDDISEQAKDLIKHLLVVDPNQRFTAKQLIEHPWILQASDKNLPQTLINMRSFNARRKFKTGVLASVAASRMKGALGSATASPTIGKASGVPK